MNISYSYVLYYPKYVVIILRNKYLAIPLDIITSHNYIVAERCCSNKKVIIMAEKKHSQAA